MLRDLYDMQYYVKLDEKIRTDIIENMFIFALYASIGGTVISECEKKKFDVEVREMVTKKPQHKFNNIGKFNLPDDGSIFDY